MGKGRRQRPTTEDILHRLRFIRCKRQEYLICLSLDAGGRILCRRTITIGLVNTTLAHPREVFAGPLKDRATAIIIAHNHPSGEVEPSGADIEMTQQLVAAGQIMGVPVLDHIIVGAGDHFSFKSHLMI